MARGFSGSRVWDLGFVPTASVPVTMAGWFLPTDVSGSESIIAIGSSTESFAYMELAKSGDLLLARSRSVLEGVDSSSLGTISAGTWHHGAAVFATTTSRVVYLDGTAGTGNVQLNVPLNLDNTSFGTTYVGFSFQAFDGDVCECGIWGVALSAPEIAALAAGVSPLSIRPQSLLIYESFVRDDFDRMGSGIALVENGSPTFEPHCPGIYYPEQLETSFVAGAPAPPSTRNRAMVCS